MTTLRSNLFFLFSIVSITFSSATEVSGQWVQTNGPLGESSVQALTVIDTNLIAGNADGISLSTDNGTSWNWTGYGDIDPDAFVMSGSSLFAAANKDQVYMLSSIDSGLSWTPVENGQITSDIYAFAVIDSNLFAGTSFNGIFRTTNNGLSWMAIDSGLPTTCGIITMAVSGSDLFAGADTGSFLDSSCIFLSTNLGATWEPVNSGMAGARVSTLLANGTSIFAATNKGIFLSSNSGTNWNAMNIGLTDNNVATLAASGSFLFAGTYDSGVFLSTNNGTSWIAVNSGLTDTRVLTFAMSSQNLFAGTVGGFVYRRPLSDFILSGVTENYPSNASENLRIFPNPASGDLQILGGEADEVHLFDLMGREVLAPTELVNGGGTLDVSHLEPGMYFVRSGDRSAKIEIAH
jgi:hypothetical protein